MKLNAFHPQIQIESHNIKQNNLNTQSTTSNVDVKSQNDKTSTSENRNIANTDSKEDDETKQPEETSQEQTLKNIDQLQNKIKTVKNDETLSKTQQQQQLTELNKQLDDELSFILPSEIPNNFKPDGEINLKFGNILFGIGRDLKPSRYSFDAY